MTIVRSIGDDGVGTATACAFGFTYVVDSSEDAVVVDYRWPREGDSNAAPSGTASLPFRWNGSDVAMGGTLPEELLTLAGCNVDTGGNDDSSDTSVPPGALPATR